MNNIMREETKKLIQAALEERGLTNLCGMFSAQHNVPRGTHKVRQPDIANPIGGTVQDTEARAAINLIINALKVLV